MSARRFNEAAAVMPRKITVSAVIVSRRQPGFNEAAAVMPRKILPSRRPGKRGIDGLQ